MQNLLLDLANKKAIQEAFINGISIHLSYKECDDNLLLILRAIDSVKEDDEYSHLIETEDAMEYIKNLGDRLYGRLRNISLYDININEVEICSECGKVLLPDDECYVSHNNLPLCDTCSYRCECCDEYFTESEIVKSANGYCCSECEKSSEYEPNPIKKLAKKILEAFGFREQACKDENWDEEHTQMLEVKDHAVDLAGMILDIQPSQAKYIESVTTDKVELEVYECSCGFHLGIDATYVDQVSDCSFICPSCGEIISTKDDDENSEKMKFSTVEEGLETIKEAYRNGEVVEGEFADYLINHYSECFDESVEPLIAIQAIQKFRQWDYSTEEDPNDCFGGTEALSENAFYGFIFERDGKSRQLPDGVRIGILKEDGAIELDEGITPAFSTVTYAHASGYCKEDNELFENYLIAIGKWDGISNDDHIFFWFSSEDEILGTHNDFVIMSYLKDGDGEEKRVSATPRFCIVQNTKEEGSSTLEDYDNLESAMEAYGYIKENGCHKSEENDGEIISLEGGTEISMDIEWWDLSCNCLVLTEGIDVPVITIQ